MDSFELFYAKHIDKSDAYMMTWIWAPIQYKDVVLPV